MKKLGLIGLVMVGILAQPVDAAVVQGNPRLQRSPSEPTRFPPRYTCPNELQPLTTALLRDLPSYINRLNLRLLPKQSRASYAIATSQPELEPLPLSSSEVKNPKDDNLHQVFFTVLERQYSGKQVSEFQEYHWVFLTQTEEGWQLALMFSRLGVRSSGERKLITPPRESSQSLTAQAIRLWLRDCRAGAIKP